MKTHVLTPLLLALAATAAPAAAQLPDAGKWGGAWGYATSPATRSVRGTLPPGTYRFRVRLSQTGDGARLTFTNPQGAVPLVIGHVSIARAADRKGFAIDPASERTIVFGNGDGMTIAAGKAVTTAPVDFAAKSGGDVIVTVATDAPSTTVAANAGFPMAFGDGPADAAGTGFEAKRLRPFLTMIAVRDPSAACTIVAFGDSITEGARGTRAGWRGWPGSLAERLVKDEPKRHCGVVNAGISGNQLLREGRGTAGIDRFDRDVATVPGATDLILLEGINDIWRSKLPGSPPLTAESLIAGYKTMIAKAHAKGMRAIGATLTPGWGSKFIGADLEQIREQVNQWIRTGGTFDAVVDFEAAVRDDSTPPKIKSQYDSGDHLHPSDAGYEAIGHAIPLSLFPPR